MSNPSQLRLGFASVAILLTVLAATPKPFACLSTPDFDRDDDDRADDFDIRFATLRGSFVPNALSTGIDLHRDRVVLAIDEQVVVIEPGAFVCRGHNRCRFTDQAGSLVRSVRLEQKKNGRWTFTIATRLRPWSVHSLFVRIGANWGGLDFVHDRYVAALAPSLDTAHHATATIGSAGGTIQTTDAAGVVISLEVPPGALTADTAIVLTPLASSPMVATGAIHPGVNFEPHGLQFAVPATLTMDFSASGQTLTDADTLFLLTSPMTALPMLGTVDTASQVLTAQVHHFSTMEPAAAQQALTDLKAWTDPILASAGQLTLAELESALALAAQQQRQNPQCSQNCIDLEALADRLTQSISTLVTQACALDVGHPTDQILARWLKLDALGQQMGADTTPIRPCVEAILRALIVDAGRAASANPSQPNLARLPQLRARADALGFTDLSRLALVNLAAAIRALIAQASQVCPVDPVAGNAQLNGAIIWTSFVDLDPTVDPSLTHDLLAAIDNCRAADDSGTITAIAYAAEAAGYFGPCGEERPCHARDHLESNDPLPIGLNAPGLSVSVTQPTPNVIAFDVVATGAPDTFPSAQYFVVELVISHAQPGQVSVVRNSQWGSACPIENWLPDPAHPDALFISYSACPGGYFNGSGRLVTITFTPSP